MVNENGVKAIVGGVRGRAGEGGKGGRWQMKSAQEEERGLGEGKEALAEGEGGGNAKTNLARSSQKVANVRSKQW